jgi:hypothetical protein
MHSILYLLQNWAPHALLLISWEVSTMGWQQVLGGDEACEALLMVTQVFA